METSVKALLPKEAQEPVSAYSVELIARGLLRPIPAVSQRLAIDLQNAESSRDALLELIRAKRDAMYCICKFKAYSGQGCMRCEFSAAILGAEKEKL